MLTPPVQGPVLGGQLCLSLHWGLDSLSHSPAHPPGCPVHRPSLCQPDGMHQREGRGQARPLATPHYKRESIKSWPPQGTALIRVAPSRTP